MIFATTAGEEQNEYGAIHLAQTLKNASANVEGNWYNDIVGTGSYQPFAPINNYAIRLFGASLLYPNVSSAAYDQETGIILVGRTTVQHAISAASSLKSPPVPPPTSACRLH